MRRGARDILQRVIEADVQVLMDMFAAVTLFDGRRAVVRNGYLPAAGARDPHHCGFGQRHRSGAEAKTWGTPP